MAVHPRSAHPPRDLSPREDQVDPHPQVLVEHAGAVVPVGEHALAGPALAHDVDETHVTAPERAALSELQAAGLHDVVRDRWPGERVFSYWDYRAGMFHQDLGMRIDLILAASPIAGRVQAAWIDRQARKGKGPSDHAPVIVDLDAAPDGNLGPVVPPPSAPVPRRGAHKLPQG